MKRHETDWFSLVVGVLALGSGVAYLFGRAYDVHSDARHVVPVILLVAGLLGLLSAGARLWQRRDGS